MVDANDRRRRLLALLRDQPCWTGAALAAQLGVTARTVRADIDQLRSVGYDIDACRGMGGGYRLRTPLAGHSAPIRQDGLNKAIDARRHRRRR